MDQKWFQFPVNLKGPQGQRALAGDPDRKMKGESCPQEPGRAAVTSAPRPAPKQPSRGARGGGGDTTAARGQRGGRPGPAPHPSLGRASPTGRAHATGDDGIKRHPRTGPESRLGVQGGPQNPVPPSEAVLTWEAPSPSAPPPSLRAEGSSGAGSRRQVQAEQWVLTHPACACPPAPPSQVGTGFLGSNPAPRTRRPLLPSCFPLRLKSTQVTPSRCPLKCRSSEGSSWGDQGQARDGRKRRGTPRPSPSL